MSFFLMLVPKLPSIIIDVSVTLISLGSFPEEKVISIIAKVIKAITTMKIFSAMLFLL